MNNKAILNYEDIFKLKNLEFVRALCDYETKRFDKHFLKGSVYEDMNRLFGIFPAVKCYPQYFTGDLLHPKNKFILIGINPGYNDEANAREQAYHEEQGLFNASCKQYGHFKAHRRGLIPYYANAAGFLRRLYKIHERITWDWLDANLINLELIPYHSKDSSGLRINDLGEYRKRYFRVLLKIIKYLNPKTPIFINGFSGFVRYLNDPQFHKDIQFEKKGNIWVGAIGGYPFIGLPFLTRVSGGKDALVKAVRKHV